MFWPSYLHNEGSKGVLQYDSVTHYDVKINIFEFLPFSPRNYNCVKVKSMAELLYWIALDFTGVPDKVSSECIS